MNRGMCRRLVTLSGNSCSRGVLAAVFACALALLVGCAVREPADPDRLTNRSMSAAELSALAWPSRDLDAVDRRIWMQPGMRHLYLAGLDDLQGDVRPYIWSGKVEVLCRKLAGLGVLCEVQRQDKIKEWFDPRTFVFYSSTTPVMHADRSKGPPPPGMHDLDGTPMDGMVYRWRPDLLDVKADRGIAIVLRPISGTTYIRPVINELRQRGWVVVETSLGFGIAGVGERRDAANDDDLRRFGIEIAKLADERLSESAFGSEAMLSVMREERPELVGKPVVVLGFSAGAIGAPTVAARLGSQVQAIVLVGGGVNISRIANTSELSDFGLGVRLRGQPLRGEALDTLSSSYLQQSKLDGFHTAPLLKGVPALVLHAEDDTIVPAPLGELLYQRLGHPERWTFGGGHELLFLQLGAFSGPITNWIDRTLSDNTPQNRPDVGN